jgi:hypothetical protein
MAACDGIARSPLRIVLCASAVLLALAGCTSGSREHSAGASGANPAASATARPDWAKGLGAGVTVLPPAATAAGHGSPGAAFQGEISALNAGKPAGACPYFPPSTQAQCRKALAGAPDGSGVTYKDSALGYVAIDGTKALVGSTGTFCAAAQTPQCGSNDNAAAIFDTAKPFAVLWAQALAADSLSAQNSYSLAPCVKIGSKWYNWSPPDSGSA